MKQGHVNHKSEYFFKAKQVKHLAAVTENKVFFLLSNIFKCIFNE